MRNVFKIYFRHLSIKLYFLTLILLSLYLIQSEAIFKYWAIGFVLFSAPFFEWIVHKYFLHYPFQFKNKKIKQFFYKIHEGHHEKPSDLDLIFAPTIIGFLVPIIFFGLTYSITFNFNLSTTAATYSLAYYCYYEWIHLAHHTDSYIPITSRGKKLKKHHTFHHFKNENFWWGVTTILGDNLLGTNPAHKNVSKSDSTKNIFIKRSIGDSI